MRYDATDCDVPLMRPESGCKPDTLEAWVWLNSYHTDFPCKVPGSDAVYQRGRKIA